MKCSNFRKLSVAKKGSKIRRTNVDFYQCETPSYVKCVIMLEAFYFGRLYLHV